MSAIYFHIPVCKTRCSYCAFYSTTSKNDINELVNSLKLELKNRKTFLSDPHIDTIYFGGGTPSLLSVAQIADLIHLVKSTFTLKSDAEITLEANPDDLNRTYLQGLLDAGINRLSIGVQSFDEITLQLANRRHKAQTATDAVELAASLGFRNMSIDLMYGFPTQTLASWIETVKRAIELPVQHISAYDLSYEEGTALWKMRQKKQLNPHDDDTINVMHDVLVEMLHNNGFEQYEVSNFAKNGFHSRHNSSYWNGMHYLGLGPAAHSYDGRSRCWNVASLADYIKCTNATEDCLECEILTNADKYNEFVLLALRTIRGVNMLELQEKFGEKYYTYCLKMSEKHLLRGNLQQRGDFLSATNQGFKLLNLISEDLMVE